MANKRSGKTIKVSVSFDRGDLAVLKQLARRGYEGNLSAALAEAARLLKQREAGRRLIDGLGGSTLTPEALAAIEAEQAGGPRYEPKKARRKRAA